MTSTSPVSGAASAAPATAAAKTFGADLNMFLKMLTTQMQNQDPLNPMDSTQYTQQLAQYSQVEQTIQQTSTLKDILAKFDSQNLVQATGMIGNSATFTSATAGLSGTTPASWSYTLPQIPGSATATIRSASGTTMATRTLTPGQSAGDISWDGTTDAGGRAPDGPYTIAITAADVAGRTLTPTITTAGTIDKVAAANGSVRLSVNGAEQDLATMISQAKAVK